MHSNVIVEWDSTRQRLQQLTKYLASATESLRVMRETSPHLTGIQRDIELAVTAHSLGTLNSIQSELYKLSDRIADESRIQDTVQ